MENKSNIEQEAAIAAWAEQNDATINPQRPWEVIINFGLANGGVRKFDLSAVDQTLFVFAIGRQIYHEAHREGAETNQRQIREALGLNTEDENGY